MKIKENDKEVVIYIGNHDYDRDRSYGAIRNNVISDIKNYIVKETSGFGRYDSAIVKKVLTIIERYRFD